MKISLRADIDTKTAKESANITGLPCGVDLNPCTPVGVGKDSAGTWAVYPVGSNDGAGAQVTNFAGISSPRFARKGQPVRVFGAATRFHARDEADLQPGYYKVDVEAADGTNSSPVGVAHSTSGGQFIAVSETDLMIVSNDPLS